MQPTNAPQKEQEVRRKPPRASSAWRTLLTHVILIGIVAMLLVFLTLAWLKHYTRHSEVIAVPDLHGMQVPEAEELLLREQLYLVVSDSIYSEKEAPGAVIETTPKAGAGIKRNRSIYAVINATSIQKRKVPDVYEVSRRQAESMLRAIGFTNVTVKEVGGPYNDLALYVKDATGKIVGAGEMIPYNTPLTLEVSSNAPSLYSPVDTSETTDDALLQEIQEEGWF